MLCKCVCKWAFIIYLFQLSFFSTLCFESFLFYNVGFNPILFYIFGFYLSPFGHSCLLDSFGYFFSPMAKGSEFTVLFLSSMTLILEYQYGKYKIRMTKPKENWVGYFFLNGGMRSWQKWLNSVSQDDFTVLTSFKPGDF